MSASHSSVVTNLVATCIASAPRKMHVRRFRCHEFLHRLLSESSFRIYPNSSVWFLWFSESPDRILPVLHIHPADLHEIPNVPGKRSFDHYQIRYSLIFLSQYFNMTFADFAVDTIGASRMSESPHISEVPSEVPLPIRSDLRLLLPPHAHILHNAPWQPSD